MSDNTQLNSGTGGDLISTDDVGGGVKVQRVKAQWGTDGSSSDVTLTNPLPVDPPHGSTGTQTTIVATADAQILAAATRKLAEFQNNADVDFLLGVGTATVTTSSYTVRIRPGGYYAKSGYDGAFHGFFVSSPTGQLNITVTT